MNLTPATVTAPLWDKEISHRAEKEKIARAVAAKAQPGQVIGAGSGSSAYLALLALGKREREEKLGLKIIATSYEMEWAAMQAGLQLTTLAEATPDWGFDGADEIDSRLRLIKGRGGALLREKQVMARSPLTYILADASKQVDQLGSRFAVPLEIVPAQLRDVLTGLSRVPVTAATLRAAGGKDGPVITESGNLLLDVRFENIADSLEQDLLTVPGIVESGLFLNYRVEWLQ